MFKKYSKLDESDALTMKGNRALKFHPDEIANSFTGEPQAKLVCAERAATIVQAGGSKYTAKCWLPSKMTKDEFQDTGDGSGAYQKLHT